MRLFQIHQASLPSLLTLVQPDDRLLLRRDAVYLLLRTQNWPCQVSVLQQDLQQRDVACPESVSILSDEEWVELTLLASQVIACPD
ncbi:DsrH/TusB family sulfur metabolism protein [Rheinheimera texasensis]|uniref:DsrH/TusB family sulfur metabolism protein n=1 Tax=Rheinheimera texasensis TaxID=306205 RepID=UPI0032B1D57A